MAPVSMDIIRANIERGSGSTPAELSLAMDIMKELVHQTVHQFFTSIRSCIKLVLSERSSFEFAWILLENQIENICHTRSLKQARTFLTLVEQLGICLKKLRTLEKAILMDEVRSMLNKLLTAQEHERKEMEEQMAEEARHLHNKPATKNWLMIPGYSRSSPRIQSKSLPLLGQLLPRRKP